MCISHIPNLQISFQVNFWKSTMEVVPLVLLHSAHNFSHLHLLQPSRFKHIQNYGRLSIKQMRISVPIIPSKLLQLATSQPEAYWRYGLKQLWGNNLNWDTHSPYGQPAIILDVDSSYLLFQGNIHPKLLSLLWL